MFLCSVCKYSVEGGLLFFKFLLQWSGLIIRSARRKFNHQRPLSPNQVNRLRIKPVVVVAIEHKVKVVHYSRKKDTHLTIRKSSADAVARSKAERLEDKAVIPVKATIIERM